METVAQIPKYNLNEEQEKKLILREYRSLLRSIKSRIKPGDRKLIRTAFEMAAEAHKTMRRKSGEPALVSRRRLQIGASHHALGKDSCQAVVDLG